MGILTPHEYLFLAANTYDRAKLIEERLSYPILTLNKESGTSTFCLSESVTINPDLDRRLERIMNAHFNAANVIFDPEDKPEEFPAFKINRFARKSLKQTQKDQMNQFRVLLRDPNLYQQVKQTLQKSSGIVNKSKTNEKFSYQRLRATSGILSNSRPQTARSVSQRSIKNRRAMTDLLKPFEEISKAPHHQHCVSFREIERPSSAVNLIKNSSDVIIRPFSATTITTHKTQSHIPTSRPMTAKSSRPFTAYSMTSTAVSLKLKEEPYHILTLREAALLSTTLKYHQNDKTEIKQEMKHKRWKI